MESSRGASEGTRKTRTFLSSEAPLTTIIQRDEMPLDRYIDEPLFSMLQKGRRGQRDTHR